MIFSWHIADELAPKLKAKGFRGQLITPLPVPRGRAGCAMSIDGVQDKQKEIAFFDAHAASDEYDVFTPEASARLIRAFVRLSGLPRGARVADLGCGSGVFTELLRRAGYSGVGLDISPKLVALGRSKYPGLELIEGDVENLPFGNGSFDGVLLSGLVHHFPDPRGCAAEVFRVLQARRPFRRLRSEPHEPVHVALSRSRRRRSTVRSGVTENERPILASRGRRTSSATPGFRVQTDYLAGLAYRYVASPATRMLLPIYNFIDGTLFELAHHAAVPSLRADQRRKAHMTVRAEHRRRRRANDRRERRRDRCRRRRPCRRSAGAGAGGSRRCASTSTTSTRTASKSLQAGRLPFIEHGADERAEPRRWSTSGSSSRTRPTASRATVRSSSPSARRSTSSSIRCASVVQDCVDALLPSLADGQLVVLRSTVFPGTTDWLASYLQAQGPQA